MVRRSRRQRGGANEHLLQGERFANVHRNQHGGSRELVGAPLDYTGVLDSSMRGAARLEGYDAHFTAARAQSGGSRRRRRQRGGALSPADANAPYTLLDSYGGARAGLPPTSDTPVQMKGGKRRKSRRSNRSRSTRRNGTRRQRGGYSPVASPTMLLSDYSKAGLPSFKAL
jgi:hypothetical protein